MKLLETIQTLAGLVGPPGREDDVRNYILSVLPPLVDEFRVDALGNVLAVRHGASERRLLFDAHMDEVALMVTYIEPSGYLRFGPLGSWDARVLPNSSVLVRADDGRIVPGVIGSPPPHVTQAGERDVVLPIETLAIDIGASSADDVLALGIDVGATAVLDAGLSRLAGRRLCSRALDDRAACAALLAALHQLKGAPLPWTVVACFSVGEERGPVGAGSAAYQARPDLAICLETTTATDAPGASPRDVVAWLGRGPALTIADRSLIVPAWLAGNLRELAGRNAIAVQIKKPLVGGTNAPLIERAGPGTPTAILSVPARYIHSAVSVIDLGDAEGMVALITACAREADMLERGRP